MTRRIVWPIVALLGVVALGLAYRAVQAQEERRPAQQQQPRIAFAGPMGMPVGRFVVARATENEIVLLDTTTGQLYKATGNDIKKHSEMPKMEGPRGGDRFVPKDRGRGEEKRDDKREEKRGEEKRDEKRGEEKRRGEEKKAGGGEQEEAKLRRLLEILDRQERELQELKKRIEEEKRRERGGKDTGKGDVKPPPPPGKGEVTNDQPIGTAERRNAQRKEALERDADRHQRELQELIESAKRRTQQQTDK